MHPNSDAHWSSVSGMSLRMGYFGGGDDGALVFIVFCCCRDNNN